VDGLQEKDSGLADMSVLVACAKAQQKATSVCKCGELAWNSKLVSPFEHSGINARFSWGYADHP